MSGEVMLAQDVPWQKDALCQQVDTELFFPEKGGSVREAKRVCGRCPVTDECLEWALLYNEHGVWGGTTRVERKQIKREREQHFSMEDLAA